VPGEETQEIRSDFDSPWKEALERYLHPFLALCFPRVEACIDWHRPVEFVDKELQAVMRDAESGRQYVDKLVKLFTREGVERRVLVHIEVQSQPDGGLSLRLFRYNRRLFDAWGVPVATLAVLADDEPTFRPVAYDEDHMGIRLHFEYPRCKLMDLPVRRLREGRSEIGRFILAHRLAQRTKGDPRRRKASKLRLVKELYRQGFEKEEILELFRLMDWVLPLPGRWDIEFREELEAFEESLRMPYITSIERMGLSRGREEGRQEGRQEGRVLALRDSVREALEARFGVVPPGIALKIEEEGNIETLRQWHRLAVTSSSAEAFAAEAQRGS
jgi:hypothetical protein